MGYYAEQDFRDRLVFRRNDAGITQVEMATALSVSPTWLSYLETGKRPWRYAWYERYCERLGIEPMSESECPMRFFIPRARGRSPRYAEPMDSSILVSLTASQKARLATMAHQVGVSGPELVRQLLEFAWNESNGVNSEESANSVATPPA